jgi:hypothetical protein
MYRTVLQVLALAFMATATPTAAQQPTVELHSPSGVITTTTDIHVDGIVTTNGDYTLNAVVVVLKYDPDEITISNPRSATGWDSPTTNDDAVNGYYYAVTCSVDGLSANGPIVTMAVTPVGSSAVLDDCDTLEMIGGDAVSNTGTNISVIRISDGDYISIYTAGSCGNRGVPPPTGGEGATDEATPATATDVESTPSMLDSESETSAILPAVRAMKIAGGLVAWNLEDAQTSDFDLDGSITMYDAVLLLRSPSSAIPRGWYTFQGDRSRTGRAAHPLEVSEWDGDPIWYKDLALPSGFVSFQPSVTDYFTCPPDIRPSPVVIPNPDDPNRRIIYVVEDGENVSREGITRWCSFIWRLEEQVDGSVIFNPSAPQQLFIDPHESGASDDEYFVAIGTPLVVGNRIFLTGNNAPYDSRALDTSSQEDSIGIPVPDGYVIALDATTLQPLDGWKSNTQWAKAMPGPLYGSPGWSPYETSNTQAGTPNTLHSGGSLLVATNDVYTYELENDTVHGTTGFLFGLDPENGQHRWGNTDSSGELIVSSYGPINTLSHTICNNDEISLDTGSAGGGQTQFSGTSPGGLPPMAYPISFSSPATDGNAAYVQDKSCYANARDLKTGSFLWDAKRFRDEVNSSISVQDGQLYWAGTGKNTVCLTSGPAGGDLKWYLNGDTLGYFGECEPKNSDMADAWATPAIIEESGCVIVSDANGVVYRVERAAQTPSIPTVSFAQSVMLNNERTYSSPLVAARGNTGFAAFLTGRDRWIHVRDTVDGDEVSPGRLGDPLGIQEDGQLSAGVSSSLAAWNGRLFVVVPAPLESTATARVLCYGP